MTYLHQKDQSPSLYVLVKGTQAAITSPKYQWFNTVEVFFFSYSNNNVVSWGRGGGLSSMELLGKPGSFLVIFLLSLRASESSDSSH